MKTLLAVALLAVAIALPAHAGNELQVQFQRWSYNPTGGYAELLVSLRNNTMKPFARVVWACELYDDEKRVVGETALVFHAVPWGAIVSDTQIVYATDQFRDGACVLVNAEPVTKRNERLYANSPRQVNIGNALPEARQFFDARYRMQGRAKVATDEENRELEALFNAGRLNGLPGYPPK